MKLMQDQELLRLFEGVLGILLAASLAGWFMKRRYLEGKAAEVVANFNTRVRAWWVMCFIFAFSSLAGRQATVVLFALTSLLALREFVSLVPTRRADYQTLFWVFFIILPYQYLLVALDMYGMFLIFIPVWAFLFIPARAALQSDTEQFLARSASIQWGLMVCVYCVSYAPSLLVLPIPGYEGKGARLLMFLVLVNQLSDVFQYLWGKLLGRHRLSEVSPNKTWEGLLGGGLSAVALGAGIHWATPFGPWQAAGMALAIVVMGFLGGLVMSAVKRDRQVKDFGALVAGHGGVMDRIDSICFAAPVFYHLTRFFYVP